MTGMKYFGGEEGLGRWLAFGIAVSSSYKRRFDPSTDLPYILDDKESNSTGTATARMKKHNT